jgi:hypothetical protein
VRTIGEADLFTPEHDGAALLDDVMTFALRFVAMTTHQATATALWTAHAHAIEAAEATPYLAITSAEKRSGKSRLLETLGLVVPRALATANVSPAALFRVIAEETPTLLIDESDAIFGGNKERGEELRGLLNAGHRRGAEVVRMVGMGSTMKAERFPVFCAKAIAGIGALPDTIANRSIAIRLKRRRAGEPVERFRLREVAPVGAGLRRPSARGRRRPAMGTRRACGARAVEGFGRRRTTGRRAAMGLTGYGGGAKWPGDAPTPPAVAHEEKRLPMSIDHATRRPMAATP